ncbi:hypothetical protein [Haliangium sp.]|uniref:hypothetical protein n=1 Tax=Haliangium sp. TaxID=2663208 RepID=UPI003D127E21
MAIIGCGGSEGAEPAEAQQRIQATVPAMNSAFTSASDRWADDQNLSALTGSLDTMGASFERLFPGYTSSDGEDVVVASLAGLVPDGHLDGEEADFGAEIEALAELIFTEENYEGGGVYRFPASQACEVDGAVDPDCVSQFEQLELRVRAIVAEDGLDITFLIGPDRAAPFGFELRSRRASLVVDLGDVKDAIVSLAESQGEAVTGLPTVMEGVIALSVLAPSDTEAEVQASVRRAIRFQTDAAATGIDMSMDIEARDPMYSVLLGEDRMTMTVDVGRTRIVGPWDSFSDEGFDLGTLDIDWQGLSYQIEVEAGQDRLAINDISLGDGTSAVKLDGATLLSVDLNRDSGRSFDLELTFAEDGSPRMNFAPGVDLQVSYDLQSLVDGGVAIDSPLAKTSYSLSVRGANPSLAPVEPDALGLFPGGVRVVSGEIAVSADGEELVVAEGRCLIETIPAIDAHPLMGALAAVDCP